MKVLPFFLILGFSVASLNAFAHLDDNEVAPAVKKYSKELTREAFKQAKETLAKVPCTVGNNGPEDSDVPTYRIQMLNAEYDGPNRYSLDTASVYAAFLVLKSCPSGATQDMGDLTIAAGVIVKGDANFKKEKLNKIHIDSIKNASKGLLDELTEGSPN